MRITFLFVLSCVLVASSEAQTIRKKRRHKKGHISVVHNVPLTALAVKEKIRLLANKIDGVVGVHALHVESGYSLGFNESEVFPLASTCKVPLACALLSMVDKGFVSLDERIKVAGWCPGSGILKERFFATGMTLPLRELIRLMIQVSDNIATDSIFKTIGGPRVVNKCLRSCGIQGISIDRPILRMLSDYSGITLPTYDTCSPKLYYAHKGMLNKKAKRLAHDHFYCDHRDTASPQAFTNLLKHIALQTFLTKQSTQVLIDAMRLCQTGAARIPGLLPFGTSVAHKTGSLGECGCVAINDVGIITLPKQAGHIAIAVFIKSKKNGSLAQREQAIARITRLVFDHMKSLITVPIAIPAAPKSQVPVALIHQRASTRTAR